MHICVQRCNCSEGHIEGLALSADTELDQITLTEFLETLNRIAERTGGKIYIEDVTRDEFMNGEKTESPELIH
jgi:hypothetical protein